MANKSDNNPNVGTDESAQALPAESASSDALGKETSKEGLVSALPGALASAPNEGPPVSEGAKATSSEALPSFATATTAPFTEPASLATQPAQDLPAGKVPEVPARTMEAPAEKETFIPWVLPTVSQPLGNPPPGFQAQSVPEAATPSSEKTVSAGTTPIAAAWKAFKDAGTAFDRTQAQATKDEDQRGAVLPATKVRVSDAAKQVDSASRKYDEVRTRGAAERVADDLARLDPGVPLLLFPVRLEARFDLASPCLRIRIYPDEILADAHEAGLTEAELIAGRDLWDASRGGTVAHAAWRELVRQFPPERAAWILHATRPESALPAPRAGSWTRPVEARLLPDRWVAKGYRGGVEVFSVESRPVPAVLPLTISPRDTEPSSGDAWLTDYDRAYEAGMAVNVPLDSSLASGGLDQLLVFGVRASLGPDDSAGALAALLAAHRYTNGLGFLAPGTSTTNTRRGRAPWPAPDPNGAGSHALVSTPPQVATGDRVRVERALGLTGRAVFDAVDGRDLGGDARAEALGELLFAGTVGHYLETLLECRLPDGGMEEVRRHFVRYVRGRGPFPTLRAGRVPYGLLPVSSLRLWKVQSTDPDVVSAMPYVFQTLVREWLRQANARVPRLGPRTDDGQRVLQGIFRRDGTSSSFGLRAALGGEAVDALLESMGRASPPFREVFYRLLREAPEWFGVLPDALPLGRLLFEALASRLRLPCVTTEDLPDALRAIQRPHGASESLRGSILGRLLTLSFARERTAGRDLDAFIPDIKRLLEGEGGLPAVELSELLRLTTEALDISSFRLDAWITSLYTRRLFELRQARPTGLALGAFGWLEDLRYRTAPANIGGYVHAPSIDHAATAAVLRNAWLAGKAEVREGYALDLSSARVREALAVLANLREGMSLSYILGTAFEAMLSELRPPLLQHLPALRAAYPLVEGKIRSHGAVTGALASQDVVDGLALLRSGRALRERLSGDASPPTEAGFAAIEATLARLEGLFDAVTDLCTAEATHRSLRGGQEQAGAALDVVSRGASSSHFDVVTSPRNGVALSHRVLLILNGAEARLAAEDARQPWSLRWGMTPRALVAPDLDLWLGNMLGSPEDWQCVVEFRRPRAPDTERPRQETVTLARLALRPLDVLALAGNLSGEGAGTEFWHRVVDAASASLSLPAGIGARCDFDRVMDPGKRPFRPLFSLLRLLRNALVHARPLRAEDLSRPREALGALDDSAEATTVRALASRLQTLGQELGHGSDADRERLLREVALFGVGGAFLSSAEVMNLSSEALQARVEKVVRELARREAAFQAATTTEARTQAVLGEEARVFPATPFPAGWTLSTEYPGLEDWFTQVSRARSELAPWRILLTARKALGKRPELMVYQHPWPAGAPWCGQGPFAEDQMPAPGTISLLAFAPFGPPTGSVRGLLLDEWQDVFPATTQVTGISLHYENPGSEAANALLLAVPPRVGAPWTMDVLTSILQETLDLAKVRAVAPEDLQAGPLAQWLPGIFLPERVEEEEFLQGLLSNRVGETTFSSGEGE